MKYQIKPHVTFARTSAMLRLLFWIKYGRLKRKLNSMSCVTSNGPHKLNI